MKINKNSLQARINNLSKEKGVHANVETVIAEKLQTILARGILNSEGWEVHSTYTDGKVGRRQFPQFVQGKLQKGIPIIVDNIDWGGHYRIIIGYDTMGDDCFENDVLIMADPYDTTDHLQDGYGIEPAARFYYMWFAGDLDANGKRIKQLWMTIGKKL